MKVGSTTVNGIFEYKDNLTYTEGDIVSYSYNDEALDRVVRRLYYVKAEVTGVEPSDESVYYEDYFVHSYGESQLTVAGLVDTLKQTFEGLGIDGVFTPLEISSDGDALTKSGIYKIVDGGATIVTFIGSEGTSYALKFSSESVFYNVGTYDEGTSSIDWDGWISISTDMRAVTNKYINKLTALEVLLREEISQLADRLEALDSTFTNDFNIVFNVNHSEQ